MSTTDEHATDLYRDIDRERDRAPFVPEPGELVFARCHRPNAELIRGLDRDHPNPSYPLRIGLAVSKADSRASFTSGWFSVRRVSEDGREIWVAPFWKLDEEVKLWVQGVR